MAIHVLITGGASGLGLGAALGFAKLGHDLTVADIDRAAGLAAEAQLKAAGARQARYEAVDLADPGSITDLAARMRTRAQPIDVLVNNAGIYPPSRRAVSREGHELTFAIAHLGHFRLTHALWPLIEAAPSACVISVSSLVQRQARLNLDDLAFERSYQPIKAYQQAKLSSLLFALELHRRLAARGSPVRSFAVHPGVCRTQLAKHRRTTATDSWWQRFSSATLRFGMGRIGQSPEQGAAPILAAAAGEYQAGSFIGPTGPLEAYGKVGLIRPGVAASDAALAAELWRRTEEITGIRW